MPLPHCSDTCILVRLGFSAEERDALATAAAGSLPEARAKVEVAIARRALDDRLTAVTALAAGVAHELNNPLAYVSANVGFLAEKAARVVELLAGAPREPEDLDLATQLAEALQEARTGAERMRAVVSHLKTFARLDPGLPPHAVDVLPVVDACLDIARPEIAPRARLVRDLGPLSPVLAREELLSQVFLNLFLNAAQAIRGGDPARHEIRVSGRTLPDCRVAVEVRDTGSGIAPEHLPRIFDPFFTTREPGRGTGLGLSICHAVVTAMGGVIEVETAVGAGSCFRVVLPALTPEAARHAGPPAPPPGAPPPGEPAEAEPGPVPLPLDGTLDLHAFAPADVGSLVPEWLEASHAAGLRALRIVHGKGTGALRRSVEAILDRHPLVASFGPAGEDAGGWGATRITLR